MTESVNDTHESTTELMDIWALPSEPKAPEVKPKPAAPAKEEAEPGLSDPAPENEEVEPVKKKSKLSADTTAEIFIGSLGVTQALILSPIIRAKMKRRLGDNFEKAMLLMEDMEMGKRAKTSLTEDEMKWYIRIRDLYKTENDLPFSDTETEDLKKPLIKIIQDSGMDIPPNLAFSLVALEVMAPRIVSTMFD